MKPKTPVFFVPRAATEFEVNRSRELRNVSWVAWPNDLGRGGYLDLVDHADGAAHLGAYLTIVLLASRAKPRWHLVDELGRPHTAQSLSRATRLALSTFQACLPRLVSIGLLEIVGSKPRKVITLPSQDDAVIPQAAAAMPQDAAETPQARNETNVTGRDATPPPQNRTKREATREVSAERRTANNGDSEKPSSHTAVGGGGENPRIWASPTDELKTIFLEKAGEPISVDVLDAVQASLSVNCVSMSAFVDEVRLRAKGEFKNPAGLLRSLAKRFRSRTAKTSAPMTVEQAADRDYKCAVCGSAKRGEGLVLKGTRQVACVCASPEYIEALRAEGETIEDAPIAEVHP